MKREDLFIKKKNNSISNNINDNYSIVFKQLNNKEILRLELTTGSIYVYGKLIENDKEVVKGLRDFLSIHGFIKV